jgi:transposase
MLLFVGVDWGEAHHDLCLLDQDGAALAARRIADGLAGVGELHALVAAHAQNPAQVAIGIETDRGLLVGALVGAGYQVYAVNPLAVSRYRDRHRTARVKSDRGDAKVLADLVRTDRHNHRQVAGDTPLAEAVKVLARAHQSLVWTRQRHVNALRSALREFYPGGTDCPGRPARRVGGLSGAGACANAGAGPPAHPGSGAAGPGRRRPAAQPAGAGGGRP